MSPFYEVFVRPASVTMNVNSVPHKIHEEMGNLSFLLRECEKIANAISRYFNTIIQKLNQEKEY